METKAQVGAEPTTEERKHLEECRREEMELLKGKGGSPESEAEERGNPAHTLTADLLKGGRE